jgi:hypothetical protein
MAVRGIGDNGGPPLEDDPLEAAERSWRLWCWKRAHRRAWKTPPREIALRRLANAEAAGVSYRAYTLEIMERGIYLPSRTPAGEKMQSATATAQTIPLTPTTPGPTIPAPTIPAPTTPAPMPSVTTLAAVAGPPIARMPRTPRLAMGHLATAWHRPRQRA